jgi:dihydroorotase
MSFEEKEITMCSGFYLKQDLENILSFKKKMFEEETAIPNIKDFLSSKQSFCYPNTEERRMIDQNEISFLNNY